MKNFIIKPVSCLEKVLPNKAPKLIERENVCLKNEVFSFQIAYFNKSREWFSDFPTIEVKSDIKEYIQLRNVENVICSSPTTYRSDDYYLTKKVEVIPEILKDDSPFIIKLQKWQSVWVTIKGNIPSGKHIIHFIVKDNDNNIIGKTKYTLTVLDMKLPEKSVNYTNWFHYDGIANYYNEVPFTPSYNKIMWSFIDNAIAHGVNTLLIPLFTPALDTKIGGERITTQLVDITYENNQFTFNFDRLKEFLRTAKEKGIQIFEMCHLFTQWGAVNTPKIMVQVNGKEEKMFGWHIKAEDEVYLSFLKQFLTELIAFLKENNYNEDEVIFHISDEPNATHLQHYLKLKQVIKPILGNYQICDALSNYDFYKQQAVDRAVVATDAATPFIENDVENYWVYYCCTQNAFNVSNRFISMPLLRTRIIGIQLYITNAKGLLHWGYNFYNSALSKRYIDPYLVNDADGMFQSGDAFIVYPKKDGTCYDSIRHEAMYDAFQDYRLLCLLQEKIGRDKVLAFLYQEGFKKDFFTYPKDDKKFIELRQKLISML